MKKRRQSQIPSQLDFPKFRNYLAPHTAQAIPCLMNIWAEWNSALLQLKDAKSTVSRHVE